MEKSKYQYGGFRVRLIAEHTSKSSHIVERLVHDGQADNGIDYVGIDVCFA